MHLPSCLFICLFVCLCQVEHTYTGPLDSEIVESMYECDADVSSVHGCINTVRQQEGFTTPLLTDTLVSFFIHFLF